VRPGFDLKRVWLAVSVVGIVAGGVLTAAGQHDAANVAWGLTTAIGAIPITIAVIGGIVRRETGVDLIALLAIAGSLALGEYLAGAVIALMLSTGQTLEAYAGRRAHEELSSLLARAPQTVTRHEGRALVTRGVDEVAVGDRLFVKTGEVIPVDGVLEGAAVLDESALTGESRPVARVSGDRIRSGALNAGPAFDLRATATAADSTYAGIVRLVEEAERQKAPFIRIADR
jgi:cation transport ATPase